MKAYFLTPGPGGTGVELRETATPSPKPGELLARVRATPRVSGVAYDMLVAQGQLGGGQWLLVTGVSSGVGVAALQTGKVLGARVIGTSGSADKLARLEKLGLDVGIRTRAADFHDAV